MLCCIDHTYILLQLRVRFLCLFTALTGECFATCVTDVWSVITVNTLVCDKTAQLIENFIAYITDVWFVNTVSVFVRI